MKFLVYDIEIAKAIQGKGEARLEGIEYCAGWQDHAGMGISCIGAYQSWDGRYRVFMEDNKAEFFGAVDEAELIVGYNNKAFDNKTISACWAAGFPTWETAEYKTYDLLVDVWIAAGLSPEFQYPTHVGYGLDAVCMANFRLGKTGNGALAPVDFQRGRYGHLIDYCLNDVAITRRLFEHVMEGREVLSPKNGFPLTLPKPHL